MHADPSQQAMLLDPALSAAICEAFVRAMLSSIMSFAVAMPRRKARLEETTHAVRIATRRARAALRLFEEVLPKRQARVARRELRRLLHLLAAKRQLDVESKALAALLTAEPQRREIIAVAQRALERRAASATRAAREALREKRLRRTRERLLALTRRALERRTLQSADSAPTLMLPGWLEQRCRRESRAWLQARPAMEAPPEEWHRFRIHTKRLRYLLEAASTLGASRWRGAATRLKAVQDLLGQQHDDLTLATDLGEIAAHVRKRRLAAALVDLATRVRQRARATGPETALVAASLSLTSLGAELS